MIKKERDSKFVIYQVLYIFVITVLALKGADLNLSRVVAKDEAVDLSVRDSLLALIDSLYAQGLNFNIEIDPNVAVENVELKEKLASLNEKVQDLTQKIKEIPPESRQAGTEKEPDAEQTLMQLPISVSQTFIQNTWNKARNTGNVPTMIYDRKNMNTPIVTIPPGQERIFDLTDQTEVIAKFGTQEEKIKVLRNKLPEIKIERVTTKMSGSDIIDERPDQIKVTYNGPISVTGPVKDSKGNPVYNVSLNIAATENKFEEWLDRHGDLLEPDGRYKANFFFTAVDERSKDRVQIGDSFFFTDFSK